MTKRLSKYRAVRTTVDGVTFASKKEAKRYQELKLLEKAGKIANLELQPEFPICVGRFQQRVATYRADFRYEPVSWDYEPGETVVEDVKGMRTPVYRLKKKLVEALYGIEIREV